MAETVIGAKLTVDSGQAEKSVRNFKKELKDANAELIQMSAKFGSTSIEAVNAAKKVATLKDAIGDAKQLSDSFNPDRKFAAFSTAIQGVVGGFSALQGAIGLFGVKSKDLEATLVKVQSAMALSQGLSSLLAAGEGFKNLRVVAVAALTRIKEAIGATGIGLLVIALGAIVTYWQDIKEAVFGVSEEQKKLLETATKLADKEEEKLKHISEQDNVLKLQGKTEEQILKIKIKQTDEVIAAREQQLIAAQEVEKAQIAAAERNKKIALGIIEFLTAPVKFVIEKVGGLLNKFGADIDVDKLLKAASAADQKIAGFFFDPEETKKEGDEELAVIKKSIDELKNQRAGYQLSIRDINRTAQKKNEDDERKHIEEMIRMRKEAAAIDKQIAEDAARARAEIEEKRRKAFEQQAQSDLDNETKKLEAENKRRLNQIFLQDELDASRQTKFQKELEDLEEWYRKKLEIARGNEQLTFELTEQYETMKSALVKLENDRRVQIVSSVLGQAANLFGKHTAAYKILATSEAIINTYLGATQALRAPSILPAPFGTALKIAQAALVIANGLKSVREITKTNVPGGGGGGLPALDTSSSAPLQPQTPQVQTTALDQESLNKIGNATVRAYVLDTDSVNHRERNERLNRAARLGG